MKTITIHDSMKLHYIAGFLDGDGCINVQIVRRVDYKLKFQIRFSVTFFQKTKHHWFMLMLHKQLKYGTLRKRRDGISEYNLVGSQKVRHFLIRIRPMLLLKRKQAFLVLNIISKLSKSQDPQSFVKLCELVDHIAVLNDSKKRIITASVVRSELGV